MPNGFDLGLVYYSAINSFDLPINYYRPCSFFSEPAYYSTNALISLLFLLFEKDLNVKNKKLKISLHIIGILLSASTAGLYLFALILFFYFFLKNRTLTKRKILYSYLFLFVAFFIIYNLDWLLLHLGSLGRTLYNSLYKVNNYSSSSRIGKSFDYITLMDNNRKLFGYGLGNEYAIKNGEIFYMNAFTRLFLQTGIFGIIIYIIFMIKGFIKSNNLISKYLIIMILIKCLTGNMFFSTIGIFGFSTMYISNKMEIEKGEKNEG
jgi:hypothetical protein